MDNLLTKWNYVQKKIQNKDLYIFLDYDGTLTPIAETPEKAVFPSKTKAIVEKLSMLPWCRVAIISGRSLKDVKAKVGLDRIIYSGNHGLELEGNKFSHMAAIPGSFKAVLDEVRVMLENRLSSFKGVLIEDKGLSLAVHYRMADKKDIMTIRTVFHESIAAYLVKNKIKIKQGKMVLEVRPVSEMDKGKVVLWLLARERFIDESARVFPIYIGDDATDEDAFFALRDIGLTVFVGDASHGFIHAQYMLKNTAEVMKFLTLLLETHRESR
ncbi:MAG: trehalose-phosphatase [Candidatus Omnitrophica bacterium]|nr:trehalose-phosphatase [Candidatus Omnitrophota bacterium]